jgi:hypothetical protein
MNNLEKYLFKHILNAKIAPTRLDNAEDIDWSPVPEEEVPTDWTWVQTLLPTLGIILITLLVKLSKRANQTPDTPPSREKSCAEKTLEILTKELLKLRGYNQSVTWEAAVLLEIIKELIDKLDDKCKSEFLALPELQAILGRIGDKLGLKPDEVLERLKDKTPEGLIAIATMYLQLGAQNAAIRMYVLGKTISDEHPGGNERLANWVVGLGLTVAMLIALGLGIAAGSVLLDLTGIGAAVGVPAGLVAATLIALGIWLQQNQGNNNSGNSA